MDTLLLVVVCLGALCMPLPAWSQEGSDRDLQTLKNTLLLVGPRAAHLPIVLSARLSPGASSNAEAWIVEDNAHRAIQIVVYTGSETFRCAAQLNRYQCRLKLASIIVHEAWHLEHGADERQAYAAQLAFLVHKEASPETLSGVILAWNHVVAMEKRAREAARKRYAEGSSPAGTGRAVMR